MLFRQSSLVVKLHCDRRWEHPNFTYHSCFWFNDTRNQIITSHIIDAVLWEYSGLGISEGNTPKLQQKPQFSKVDDMKIQWYQCHFPILVSTYLSDYNIACSLGQTSQSIKSSLSRPCKIHVDFTGIIMITVSHMPVQLSCRDMFQFFTWIGQYNDNQS